MFQGLRKKIMLIDKYNLPKEKGRSISFRASCDCYDQDCDLFIDIEYDKEYNMIILNFYKNIYIYDQWNAYWDWEEDKWPIIKNWFKNIKTRLIRAFVLLTTGNMKMNESFIIRGDEQLDDFIKTLQEGKQFINEGE